MNTNVIEGNPTKKFFIEMITRDISMKMPLLIYWIIRLMVQIGLIPRYTMDCGLS